MVRRGHLLSTVLLVALMAACGRDTPPGTGPTGDTAPADAPTEAVLTCGSDGSVTLSTDVVQPRPDGVHLSVVNNYEEPVSVAGFDADPGITPFVFSQGPGDMLLMCWPFSQHGSGNEPPRHRLQVVDPTGLFLDGEVACDFEGITTVDYAGELVERGPPPMSVVRELVPGLLPDDVLRVAGYPEAPDGPVIVIREQEVVARFAFGRFQGEAWSILAASVCEGTGLPFEGQSFS